MSPKLLSDTKDYPCLSTIDVTGRLGKVCTRFLLESIQANRVLMQACNENTVCSLYDPTLVRPLARDLPANLRIDLSRDALKFWRGEKSLEHVIPFQNAQLRMHVDRASMCHRAARILEDWLWADR